MGISLNKQKPSPLPQREEGAICDMCRTNARMEAAAIVLFGGILLPFILIMASEPSEGAGIAIFLVFFALSVLTFLRILPMRIEAADKEAKRIGSHYHI